MRHCSAVDFGTAIVHIGIVNYYIDSCPIPTFAHEHNLKARYEIMVVMLHRPLVHKPLYVTNRVDMAVKVHITLAECISSRPPLLHRQYP